MRRYFLEHFFRIAASGWIPRRWYAEPVPEPQPGRPTEVPLQLEIVSHCWQYSLLLTYQLSSLVLHPPTRLNVRMTVFHSAEDEATVRVLRFFEGQAPARVTWNWWPLERPRLFRRAIGRNLAALGTRADWIWFTDCDQVFHRGALDILAAALPGQSGPLVYPRQVGCSALLESDDPLFQALSAQPALVDIDVTRFSPVTHTRAVGALQIVRGDVARALGYCNQIPFYQEPVGHWQKCYEDRTFRWLLGTQGDPIEIPGLFRVEHARKGRRRVLRPASSLSHP
jgi:hypothetical protein